MKKINLKKCIALFLLLLLSLSFCACDRLDTMREEHATWTEDGILYKDQRYQWVGTDGKNLNYNYTNQRFVKITDADVPLLLSPFLHVTYYANEDETIITGTEAWYVRADLVEDYNESIKNGIHYTQIGFDYYDADLGENTDYILSEYERQQLMSCQLNPLESALSAEQELHLFEQSDNALFRRGKRYSIARSGNLYYLTEYDEALNKTYVYPATEEAAELIKGFFQKSPGNYAYHYQSD